MLLATGDKSHTCFSLQSNPDCLSPSVAKGSFEYASYEETIEQVFNGVSVTACIIFASARPYAARVFCAQGRHYRLRSAKAASMTRHGPAFVQTRSSVSRFSIDCARQRLPCEGVALL